MNTFPKSVPIIGRVKACLEFAKSQNLKGKTVVDIGCSFGWLEKELLSQKPKNIVGIDVSGKALGFAKKNVPQANFFQQEKDTLPLKDNFADIVILFDVIEHVKNEQHTLKEINRILKKGGKLLLTTPNFQILSNVLDLGWYFGHKHFKDKQILTLLKNTGFETTSHTKRGGIGTALYLIWLYITKRIKGEVLPKSNFFESLDEFSYQNEKIYTHFIVANKT